jgi:monoamine oxidase
MDASGVESHVGGGAAGLAAASALVAEGIDVLLLEARSGWGGRIQTVRSGPEPIELGAEFVHGDAPCTSALARTIVAWAGGPAAIALGLLSERLRVERALEDFAAAIAMARPSLEEALVEAQTHDWDRDRLSRGAYSYPLVGGTDAGSALAAPLEETLYFAGEAVSPPPINGTVEGALASGFRAAREVLGHAARDHGVHG